MKADRWAAFGVVASVLGGCGAVAPRGPADTHASPPSPRLDMHGSLPAEKSDVLVTYKGGTEIGRDRYRDDGDVAISEVVLAGHEATVTFTRSTRNVRIVARGTTIERDVPEGTVALENGSWYAYALAAEAYQHASAPTPVHVLLPDSGRVVEGVIAVAPTASGGRTVTVQIGATAVIVELGADGRITRARVPLQHLDAGPEGSPRKVEAVVVPADVTAEPFELRRPGAVVRGVIFAPKTRTGQMPVAVLVAGSGPIDRDGNSVAGVHSDAYLQIATALAGRGIATLRYDKRGVGASTTELDEERLSFADFVGDAVAAAESLRASGRYSMVSMIGHSEGGLVALSAAVTRPVDRLVLVATPGRPLAAVLREQFARTLPPEQLAQLDRVLGHVRAGEPTGALPPSLAAVFRPSVQPYLRSLLDVDPADLLRRTRSPATIIQGDADVQVSDVDAHRLAAARKDLPLVMLHNANHLMKREERRALPQRSYTDPSQPLAEGFVNTLVEALLGRDGATRGP